MAVLDALLSTLFEGIETPLRAEFEAWVRESRRFRDFAIRWQRKIHAKLKQVRDSAGMLDLRAELHTALLLLREERFALDYETYAASKARGPDFTITHRTHTRFNVEVRRLRALEVGSTDEGENDAHLHKLMAVLCDKIGQMPPGILNLLWLVAEREITEGDLTRALLRLRQMADRKDERYFTRRGYKNAADFLNQYPHLSGIVVVQGTAGVQIVWLNPLARHKLPPEIVTAVRRLTND
jgi:hypothetical protein